MKKQNALLLLTLLTTLGFWQCSGGKPSNKNVADLTPPLKQNRPLAPASVLALKPGFQIKLQSALSPQVKKWLWIETTDPQEGVSFFWVEDDGSNSSFFNSSAQDTRERGRVTLSYEGANSRLWLPAFWPAAELFLANSSGLWLSPTQFAELLSQKSVLWIPPWTQGALPEGHPLQAILNVATQHLLKNLPQEMLSPQATTRLHLQDKSEKHPVQWQGQASEVEVILASDPWASYTILKDAQNPTVLQIEFAPELSVGRTLFSPLAWLKAALNYQVVALESPKGF